MAWSVLPKPGTNYGPCTEPCEHLDCAATREMATAACRVCGKPIGYDEKMCGNRKNGYAHFVCAVEEAENAPRR